ncbi:selenocysteine-specific translation elongation factor [Natranaerobius thermophilus]|uniref:Selenocysteine-specific elongation factor n=1 Tax=Natranaerobius thermophilus (strain ATCC BAA-1301 / DSM 18059 / JW/NM-WN-LF) TaxID=457570 RepID=B2A1F7_NATTJ|nr:selenocysteine-specific translation elongation factor [Natranaerobius thermophilus]ACB84697.1 selenocysteine-specific translation elongation factor [Natranaerobius thermophilus JW/NM-WN-LF]
MHHVIGTAGHVDHGKTKLIEALTGEDTDRLQEEKDRGISVDLGFAPFKLPSGSIAGVVDVPGHEKFIHNMLAGIAGIDLVILVIDVNEGIMPQTKEHIAIMELLEIKSGIIVLTKVDQAEEEWIELMQEEVRESLSQTFLKDAPLIKTSVVSGKGVSELKELIDDKLQQVPPKDEGGPVRMPIDRAFKISGFGTVVTGTLFSGTIDKGDELEIVPSETKTRARQIQVHGKQVDKGRAGQRLAINIPNVSAENLERGYVLSEPSYFKEVSKCDVRVNMLQDIDWELKNGSPVHLHVGAGETVARIYFYGQKKLQPGESSLAQLRLEKPLAIFRKDRFIIRSYSPVTTIGGGLVLEHDANKKPLSSQKVIDHLLALEKGDPSELVNQVVKTKKIVSLDKIAKETGVLGEDLNSIVKGLSEGQKLVTLGDYVIDFEKIQYLTQQIIESLNEFQKNYPLRPGKPKAEIISFLVKSGMDEKASMILLEQLQKDSKIKVENDHISLPDFKPEPTNEQKQLLKEIEDKYANQGFRPPALEDISNDLKISKDMTRELFEYLVMVGTMIKITDNYYMLAQDVDKAKQLLKDHFSDQDTLSIGEWRDILDTTRKYALPLLEYFDRIKLTRRQEDVRVYLGNNE